MTALLIVLGIVLGPALLAYLALWGAFVVSGELDRRRRATGNG